MVKGLVDDNYIKVLLDALRDLNDGKEIIWMDLDGVVADFEKKATIIAEEMELSFEEFIKNKIYRKIDGFYKDLPLIQGSKEAIKQIDDSNKYVLKFLSAPSWENISCFSDKRIWIEENFGNSFKKRMDLSYNKGYYLGHYIIDDRTKYGVDKFIGEHIHFGTEKYPNWDSILNKLL